MATVIDIDPALLRRAHENFWLDLDDVSTGPGLDGREQVLYSENRRWIGRLDLIRLRPDAMRQAIVIGDRLRGRANVLRVTLCNHRTLVFSGDAHQFWRDAGLSPDDISRGHTLFDDGSTFDDGAGFALPDVGEPTVVADAPAGASEIQLDGYLGRNISVAAYFSIADFLYRVEANVDGQIRFNPPLRQAVAAGDQANVTNPTVRVRLRSKADWRPFCEYFRNGSPMSVNVVEAFDR
ncbi:hypothetical protein [Pacificoceanicola onchidii]|uniref:hypothetical protein n=1 Tax=Pacificoceanicola onchidii TaxID=2562685 RepID=UPI0010A352F7|nr:hypothetical protein [Pacificoceanicola onchidii]